MGHNNGKTPPDLRFLYLSPAARQALLGMQALARAAGSPFHLARDVARAGNLPANAMAKIFQRLARRGLLVSQRGPGGGYALAKQPSKIPLAEILRAVEDIVPGRRRCLLGSRACGDGGFCVIHRVIVEADRLVLQGFESLTLASLARSEVGLTKGERP